MSSQWVDFKAIKESITMKMLLARYNIRVRRVNQNYLRGKCPLPSHSSKESGDSFGVHTGKNAWACQSASCVQARRGRKGGNILDFVAAMEGCSIRDAAVRIQNWFSIDTAAPVDTGPPRASKLVSEGRGQGSDALVPEFNRPLTFELKGIDPSHEYLAKRGIKGETAQTFGVGFFGGKGSMAGRIVFPIKNVSGELVAYAGRAIDGAEPRYKLPGGFHKTLEVYNLHRVRSRDLVIAVEGFFGCMNVHQAGCPQVVGLMGSTMSERQEELLAQFTRVVLMLDGDEAGREGVREIVPRLVRRTFVKVINLADGTQPDQLSPEELKAVLESL